MAENSLGSRAKWFRLFATLSVSIFVMLLVYRFSLRVPNRQEDLPIKTISHTSNHKSVASNHNPLNSTDGIPNIVHFTMLKRDQDSIFFVPFRYFLSIYSAHVNLHPEIIYLHTDFEEIALREARENGNQWARLLLSGKMPEILINHVVPPTEANGHEIDKVEHKSDFVRAAQVEEKGGIYMDLDVYALRDVTPLRMAGFNAVVSREVFGKINNGCFMAQRNAALLRLLNRDAYNVFDGGWITHSVLLLSDIAERLVRSPGEVLIMEQPAFASTGYYREGVANLYGTHDDHIPAGEGINNNFSEENPFLRWNFRSKKGQDWEMDFSTTNFLHAFSARKDEDIPQDFFGVSIKYIEDRNSNFAIALWEVVEAGKKDGFFISGDTEL